ncbi:MAG: hypothetical protein K6G10_04810 [Butyrivibrio sp.]|nr:hypothetical protein [Butyrivibrio sp.]
MSKPWIKEKGSGPSSEIDKYMSESKDKLNGMTFFAMYPDEFKMGIYDGNLSTEDLLEARIFDDDKELLITRNCIGEDFFWRLASEKKPNIPEDMYYVRFQKIDRSMFKGRDVPEISKAQQAKIVTFVDYDENGMAYAADNRVCGLLP